jgi:hypothetical protein
MKSICSTIALLATGILATAALATETVSAQPEMVVSACKRHMIGLGPQYEPRFRLCAYLAGAVTEVHPAADPEADIRDLATIRAFTKAQLTD